MIQRLIAALVTAATLPCAAAAPATPSQGMPSRVALPVIAPLSPTFRAPRLAPVDVVSLPTPVEKAAPARNPQGPWRIGSVRSLEAPVRIARWVSVAGGFAAKVRATSAGALALRVRLDLGTMPGSMELRVQGDDGRVETMRLDPELGPEAWTPWTDGSSQVIELFSRVLPGNDDAVRIGAVLHVDTPILPKAAGTCTLETMCAPSDALLGAGVADAIAERDKSAVRISFIDGGSGFLCSATLINTEKFPAPYLLTANHCVDNALSASTIAAWWFYDSNAACPEQGFPPARVQTSGGMQLVFTNFNDDSTLLLMHQQPPEAAVYSGWNPAHLANGDAIVSVSHPEGDTARYAVGSVVSDQVVFNDRPQLMYGVNFSRGIIQGGSSGSGLFTMANGSLQLRGILTGTSTNNSAGGMSCADLNETAAYSRFEILEPEIEPYITIAGRAPDDAPNRAQDLFGAPPDPADTLDIRATPYALDNRHIDYAGDIDIFRLELQTNAWVSAWTEGANLDTVGTLLDSTGSEIAVNDDAQMSSNHFGLTQRLGPGTYYLQVAHWEPAGTGAYNLRMRADHLDTNYTDLWWNPAESGWGVNLNHQDNIIFATLFTYDATGAPMWLVMSNGARQADGTYLGSLYRTTGPAFDAAPFDPNAVVASTVGTMRLTFTGASSATMTYSYNGTQVTKSITRQAFANPAPNCTWSAFDRSWAINFQDLWWNPNESGWGVNIAHQGDTLFATLFTYGSGGQGMWLVMSDGVQTAASSSSISYSGTLYRTSGPPFNASPWPGISATPVGTMSFTFTNGNAGTMSYTVNGVTVTKAIQRQTFGTLRTQCES